MSGGGDRLNPRGDDEIELRMDRAADLRAYARDGWMTAKALHEQLAAVRAIVEEADRKRVMTESLLRIRDLVDAPSAGSPNAQSEPRDAPVNPPTADPKSSLWSVCASCGHMWHAHTSAVWPHGHCKGPDGAHRFLGCDCAGYRAIACDCGCGGDWSLHNEIQERA